MSRCPIDFFGDNHCLNVNNIPIKIYELMGSGDSGRLGEIAGLFAVGLKAYTERDWGKEEKILKNVIHAMPAGIGK